MAVNLSTFFTKFGKHAFAAQTINTAAAATVEDEVEDAAQQYTTEALEIKQVADGMLSALKSFQSSAASLNSSIFSTPVSNLLVQMVKADNPQNDESVLTALTELRRQMIAGSDSLDASTPACTPSYGGSNTGNGVIVISTKRGDGLVNEFIFGEDIEGEVTAVDSTGEATIALRGEQSIGNALDPKWPGGSGISQSLTSLVAESGSNLVSNGTFETAATSQANQPDGWVVSVGTLGTTLKLSSIEVQTVTISGTPTSGYYTLSWTNAAGDTQTTDLLAWNASQSAVQSALQALDGLEDLTVVTSGTSPNFAHTLTFTGVTNPAQLTSTSNLDTGSIAHATTTAASANVVRGARSVEFDSNGSELTTIQLPVTLTAETQYAFSSLFKTDIAPAAGVLTIDLVDGIGGTVVADEQGTNNSFTIDATALTTSWSQHTGVFRMPINLPSIVYLRIRISTAVSNTSSIFMDEVILAQMTELYTGGLYASAFTGSAEWDIEDVLTLPVTNDRAGALHEWCDRAYSLRVSNFLLPTNSAGGETIADSLIS